jgi:tungstate transport system substrate-binding protein
LKHLRFALLAVILAAFTFAVACGGDDNNDKTPTSQGATAAPTKASGTVILATTTSFQDSGLLDVLQKKFQDETGYTLKPIAVGSGQAIEQASRGDADVVFAHSPAAEKKMVDDGQGIERTLVMHNDFIIVGPKNDPSKVKGSASAADAMKAIADGPAHFISRGDQSGTNVFELNLWKLATIDPKGQGWYEESGQGMGATLQIANQKNAYTLSDRGTYLAQQKNLDLDILFENDGKMLNYYHVIVVNPEKHDKVNVTGARAFAAFLVRPDVQELIGQFGVDKYGQPLFVPIAGKKDEDL